jgi:hypothetical protein
MVLVGKLEGRLPAGRPRHRWGDNIEMNIKRNTVGRCGLDTSADKWLVVVNTVMNLTFRGPCIVI